MKPITCVVLQLGWDRDLINLNVLDDYGAGPWVSSMNTTSRVSNYMTDSNLRVMVF